MQLNRFSLPVSGVPRRLQQRLGTARLDLCLLAPIVLLMANAAHAVVPPGYQAVTVATNAPPTGLAYAPDGKLFVFEAPTGRTATIRILNPNLTFESQTIQVTSLDPDNFFLGDMAYDPLREELLLTDNAFGASALYALKPGQAPEVVATGLPGVAGVAVRSTGEIFVSTAALFNPGEGKVYMVDRDSGSTTQVMSGLDYGAGLAIDPSGDLVVQQAQFNFPYAGSLHRIGIDDLGGGALGFDPPQLLLSGMQAGAGVAIDAQGDLFVTGSGGLFEVKGNPLAATSFHSTANPFQFATAISFLPGSGPFESWAGGGSQLAYFADYTGSPEDNVITIIIPVPEPSSAVLSVSGAAGVLALASWRRRRGQRERLN